MCEVNRSLLEHNRGIALLDELRKQGPLSGVVRSAFATELATVLVGAGRYRDYLSLLDDPSQLVEQKLESLVRLERNYVERRSVDDETLAERKRRMQSRGVEQCLPIFEALVGAGHLAEAERVANRLVLFADTDRTYATLVDAAASAGDVEFAKSIAERGFSTLPENARVWLRASYDALPRAK